MSDDHPWTFQEAEGVRYSPKHEKRLIEIATLAPPSATHWKLTWGPPEQIGLNFISRGTVEYTGDDFTLSFGGGWMPLLSQKVKS